MIGTPPAPPPPQVCTQAPALGPAHEVNPGRHRQLVIAQGRGRHSHFSRVTLWTYSAGCWQRDLTTTARNGARGWHRHPWDYSYYSPIGTFTLSDAGGRLAEPIGTKLPYDYSPSGFRMPAPSTHVFDYVVAVDFNRFRGRSPLDLERPNPKINDGGIWLHVWRDGAATRGCISMPKPTMRKVLTWLDPSLRPVIVMGPRGVLKQ